VAADIYSLSGAYYLDVLLQLKIVIYPNHISQKFMMRINIAPLNTTTMNQGPNAITTATIAVLMAPHPVVACT
jgi:hypothetical protein